jgi:hypothetical protein
LPEDQRRSSNLLLFYVFSLGFTRQVPRGLVTWASIRAKVATVGRQPFDRWHEVV